MAGTIEDILAQHKAAAQEIVDTAQKEDRDLTEAETKSFDDHIAAYKDLEERAEKAKARTLALSELGAGKAAEGDGADPDLGGFKSLGENFTAGKAYKKFHATAKELGGVGRNPNVSIAPTRIASMKEFFAQRKALTTDLAHLQNIRMPMIDQVVRPELTLLDLISRGTTGGSFEYLQILAIERGAGIVPENTGNDETDVLKPESNMTTALADAKVFDYADGYTVTNQLLQDDQALASYLNNEFGYSFDMILADYLLNGTGTNGNPKGLLHTDGVQRMSAATGAMGIIEATRRAITKLKHVSASNLAILVSPEDSEEIDLLRDKNERFYGNGPFGIGPNTLWGRPTVESEQLEQGQTIVGDFRQLALLDRSGLSVQAFNQHKDYAQRNLTYVRAELRAAQVIWRPAHFVVIEGGES